MKRRADRAKKDEPITENYLMLLEKENFKY